MNQSSGVFGCANASAGNSKTSVMSRFMIRSDSVTGPDEFRIVARALLGRTRAWLGRARALRRSRSRSDRYRTGARLLLHQDLLEVQVPVGPDREGHVLV